MSHAHFSEGASSAISSFSSRVMTPSLGSISSHTFDPLPPYGSSAIIGAWRLVAKMPDTNVDCAPPMMIRPSTV